MAGWGTVAEELAEQAARRGVGATDKPSGPTIVRVRLMGPQADLWRLSARRAGVTLSDLVRASVGGVIRWGQYRARGDLERAGYALRGLRALALRTYEGWRYEPNGNPCPTCGRAMPGAETR
jgi:hypothetical protein